MSVKEIDVKSFIKKFNICDIEELQEVLDELCTAVEIFENFGFEAEAAKALTVKIDSIIEEALLFEEE